MVFMQIAISAIGIGIVVMVGYLVIAQVRTSLPVDSFNVPVYNSTVHVGGITSANFTGYTNTVNTSLVNTQATVFAGFALVAVGVIVLAAFGMISIFQ